jgi:hypothetical protein
MPLYFLLLDGHCFQHKIRPALARSWQLRDFRPAQQLCSDLAAAAQAFRQRYYLGPEEMLINVAAGGLAFDKALWRHLVGEVLWLSAADIPEIQTAPEALACLLGAAPDPAPGLDRAGMAPIQQAHFGTRDLVFGTTCYRPMQAGYNDVDDVARLAAYLAALNPDSWKAQSLGALPDLADAQDQAEELALVKEWFPSFKNLYQNARETGQVVVCEAISA